MTVPRPDFEPIAGTDLALSLRPETLGFTTPEQGLLQGQVTAIEFTGATRMYTVVAAALTVHVAAPDAPGRPDVGDRVAVGLISGQAWLVRP
jgi:hypothetical protein